MFKKTADNVHYLGRAANHSTKGEATGRVDLRKLDGTDFNSEENIAVRRDKLRALRKSLREPRRIRRQLLSIMKTEDAATVALIMPAFKDVTKAITKGKAEIRAIRATLPTPILKIRKYADMPNEWHREKHAEANKQQRKARRKEERDLRKYMRRLTKAHFDV